MTELELREFRLRHLSTIPIANGLGEAASAGSDEWPRYIRITDFSTLFTLDSAKRETLSPAVASKAQVKRDDLLLAAVGATVGTAYLHESDEAACFAGYLVRVRPDASKVLPRFLGYWTQSSEYWSQIRAGAIGSTIENFSASRYRAMTIRLPALEEQRGIVAFLDRETAEIDAFIADQEELIGLLAERRAATISHAVTKGIDPSAPLKDSGVGWFGTIPQHWLIAPLWAAIESIESGVSVNAADWPAADGSAGVLKTSCVYSGQFDVAENKSVDTAELHRLDCPVERGSVIVSRMNTPSLVGAAGLVREDAPNIYLPDRLWKVRVRGDARYFHYWTQSKPYRAQVSIASVGTSSSMQNLSQDRFAHLLIAVPGVAEQALIADELDAQTAELDGAISDAREAIVLSRERRAALISAAVTGKIDVRAVS